MAQARATLGSVLNVVSSSAGTIVSLLDNINAGAEMLSAHVEQMRVEQALSIKLGAAQTKSRIVDNITQQMTLADADTAKFCAKSPFHAERYAHHHAALMALLES